MDRNASTKGVSAFQEQRDVIVKFITDMVNGESFKRWKMLVVDENSKKVIDNVIKQDDNLFSIITNIEKITDISDREASGTMDGFYILSPQPDIVECFLEDCRRRRYERSFLAWTAVLDTQLSNSIMSSPEAMQQIQDQLHKMVSIGKTVSIGETLPINFFPRESQLITFRDPSSFPILYHQGCENLVFEHLQILAQRIAAVCIAMGENPNVRYYKPKNPDYRASTLCSKLAGLVQEELDKHHRSIPNGTKPQEELNKTDKPKPRPQGVLLITDRSMDLMAPLVHEFTYQAMAHDLLPLKDANNDDEEGADKDADNDKVTFSMTINEGTAAAKGEEMEIVEKDEVWVKNRHRHMKDTIEKLMGDFQDFLKKNPNFTDENQDTTNLNVIKEMVVGLPQFQKMKGAYSLHLTMAQECMNVFQQHKLPDLASIEQTLATGFDEYYKKPKNVLDQVVRLLDDDAVTPPERLRLIMMYILYRDGVIREDIRRLVAHASLAPSEVESVINLKYLGAQTTHALKDFRTPPPPLFPRKPKADAQGAGGEEYALSRFETAVKQMLDELCRGTLDATTFPYNNPPMESEASSALAAQQGSLRTMKPFWAVSAGRREENRQRLIVFMAGGATYSEARACYEVSDEHRRDVFLITNNMLTPQRFLRQLANLSTHVNDLGLPKKGPKPRAPAHLVEPRPPPPQPASAQPGVRMPGQRPPPMGMSMSRGGAALVPPPTNAFANMSLHSASASSVTNGHYSGGGGGGGGGSEDWQGGSSSGRLQKLDKDKDHKKKRNIFGLKK